MNSSQLIFLHDGNAAALRLGEMLAKVFPVTGVNVLDRAQHGTTLGDGTVVCLSQTTLKKFDVVRKSFGLSAAQSVFVVPVFSAELDAILRATGAKDYFVAPVEAEVLWQAVSAARTRGVEASWENLPATQRAALIASRKSFRKLFDDVRNGKLPDMADLEQSSRLVCNAAIGETLSYWLSVIKNHHDYTYRHCMFVCGTVVKFGQSLGMKPDDLVLLNMGGMLHDIGKAWIPLSILDKPNRLTKAERLEMNKHPSYSREILGKVDDLDQRIVSMAVHHHEKLDGTGYPDGLRSAELNDLARLTAIADVYSALIDERAYKPAMTPEEAFAWMENTRGHLDLDMVTRFKEYILDSTSAAA